ncbi:uncharacterized protein [Heliangelus exortis]|uniref:uncharacterized protein n=1 Tax=Heliangelus exortis TaxID=472823 RepID=UPI003A8CA32C
MLEADRLERSFAEKDVGGALLVDVKLNRSRQCVLAAKKAKDRLSPISDSSASREHRVDEGGDPPGGGTSAKDSVGTGLVVVAEERLGCPVGRVVPQLPSERSWARRIPCNVIYEDEVVAAAFLRERFAPARPGSFAVPFVFLSSSPPPALASTPSRGPVARCSGARQGWWRPCCGASRPITFHPNSDAFPSHAKGPIMRLSEAEDCGDSLLGPLMIVVEKRAVHLGLTKGFRTVVGEGPEGGRSVCRVHLRILGGGQSGCPPG